MRSKHFLGLCLMAGGFAALGLTAAGCGGPGSDPNGDGGSGGTGSTSSSVSGTSGSVKPGTSTSTSTSSSSGKPTTGPGPASSSSGGTTSNHTPETAVQIEVNPTMATAGTLVDSNTRDYYKFAGKKGQKIYIQVDAQSLAGTQGDDDTVADIVATLFDANQKQLAQNDDAWPRLGRDSQVFTVLPADGDYFLAIDECHAIFNGCGPDNVSTFDYQLFVVTTDQLVNEVVEAAEPNDTDATAKTFTYKVPQGGTAGDYGFAFIDGSFSTDKDTDVFAIDIPADLKFDANQRPHAEFWVQPITPNNGTGATANAKYSVVDSADLTKHLAEVDQTNYKDGDNPTSGPIGLSVPIQPGHKYFLFVQHAGGTSAPETDFYFASHFIGSFFFETLEKSPDNNTAAAAEVVKTPAMVTPGTYFVDGDISVAGTDVDYYSVSVPTGKTQASLFCDAQRRGSGLRGAKFSLLKTDDTPLNTGNVLNEVANADVSLAGSGAVAIPAGTANILLKVEAALQDPNVTGTYYHCTVAIR